MAEGGTARLYINGAAFLSTPLGPVVNPVGINAVTFGDDTSFAGSQTELAWFRATPGVPTTISVNPQSQTVRSGTDASISVAATGTTPFTYQWAFDGTNLVGQTNGSLLLPNVRLTNSGLYCVVVVDAFNVTNTNCATLTVLDPPGITTQPASQTVAAGSNVTFSVGANGSEPVAYQWRFNGAFIPGATNSTYTITNAQPSDGGTLSVLVVNPVGVVVSLNATLKVTSPALSFADNFADRGSLNGFSGVGSGNNTNATREAGEPLHNGKNGNHSVWLDWMAPGTGVAAFNTHGSSFDTLFAIYIGTNLNTLVAQAGDDDSGGYFTSEASVNVTYGTHYLIAIDGFGSVSGDIVLNWNLDTSVAPIPVITQGPTNVTVTNGGSATFYVTADSTNVTYQWYLNSQVLTGATNATLTVKNVGPLNLGSYTVEVTSTNGQTVSSLAGSLEIGSDVGTHSFDKLEDLFLAIQPGGGGSFAQALKKGGGLTAASLSFPSVAAGSIGSQIINNFNSTTEQGEPIHSDVIGGASRWYLLTAATNGTMVIDTIGSDLDTLLAIYTGSNRSNLNLITFDDNGAPDGIRSLVRFPAAAGTNYLIAVDARNGTNGNININWRLGTPPSGGGPGTNQTVNAGSILVLQGGDSSAIPYPAYQWFCDGVNLGGFSNATCALTNIQYAQRGVYSVVVSNFIGVVTNFIATVTVIAPPQITSQSASPPVTQGGPATFSVTATGPSPLVYQWQFAGTNLLNGGRISGANTNQLTLSNVQLSDAGNYTVIVTNIYGSVTSIGALTVNALPTNPTWNGATNTDWFNTNNWSPSGVPASNATVSLTSGTINFSAPVTFSGQFNWSGGTLTGAPLTIASKGVLNLSGSGTKFLGNALTNAGTVNWSGGDVSLNPASAAGPLVNLAGGLWNITSDRNLYVGCCGVDGNAYFQNGGTVQKLASNGTTTIQIPFHNSGTVSVLAGTLIMAPDATTQGAYPASTNALLNALVNPNGASTQVYFQWGGTTNYGQATATNALAPGLYNAQAVQLPVGGLQPASTNHFRVVAVNSAGTTLGADLLLVTLPPPPVIVQVTNRFLVIGQSLDFTNSAQASTPPVTFSLDHSAPAGAALTTNGIFTWTPACAQGSTTNVIIIWATDSGSPPLSNSMSFVATLSECVQVGLGSTVLQVGQTSAVSVTLLSTVGLTNLSFTILNPAARFTNWSIVPSNNSIATATAQVADPLNPFFNLATAPGQSLQSPSLLAAIPFAALPGHSAFLTLVATNITGQKSDGSLVGNILSRPGSVVVIGPEPLLEARLGTNSSRMLTLYGNPGANYAMEYRTNLIGTNWLPGWSVTMTNLYQVFGIDPAPPRIFYRATGF